MRTPEEIADEVGDWIGYRDRKEAQSAEILGWLEMAAREAQNELASLATARADELEAAWESGDLAQATRNTLDILRSIGGER